MFEPTLSQKALMPMASVSRDPMTCPLAAETTRPLSGYRLRRRCSTLGLERSYAALTWRVSESTMACRWLSETVVDAQAVRLANRTVMRERMRRTAELVEVRSDVVWMI